MPSWAAATSVLGEILVILPLQKLSFESLSKGGLFEPAALPVLLTQPCLAQGSGLGFITEVSALDSLLSAGVASLLMGQWCQSKIHL